MRQIALADCNNFYASCERAFNPGLKHRPIVVLSNNDGCIIARSNEAKDLGIPMGKPLHEVRALIDRHRIAVFSSNYALYGDLSRRVMTILGRHAPQQEIYSIDECFLDLTGIADVAAHATMIRSDVKQKTGIPVSVGIAPSKTLAKLANHCAKKLVPWQQEGVCNFHELAGSELDRVLQALPVSEVWGIGPRLALKLAGEKLLTVFDLKTAPPRQLKARYNVLLERIVRELNGEACLELEEVAPPKQQIVASRSFGIKTCDYNEVHAALATHVSAAAEKLRRQHSTTSLLTVFLRTNPFCERDAQLSRSVAVPLVVPSDDTLLLQQAANAGLQHIFAPGYLYHKVGVMLDALQPRSTQQPDLFTREEPAARRQLLSTLDQINRRFGRHALRSAAELLGDQWQMRQAHRSPRYTTCWEELLQVG